MPTQIAVPLHGHLQLQCTVYTYVNCITCYYILSICVIYNDICIYTHIFIYNVYTGIYRCMYYVCVCYFVFMLFNNFLWKEKHASKSTHCFPEAIWLERPIENMVSKALILFLVGAQAGIYPDNHWDFSTELTADSADAFVKDNVDAGKTASWRHKGHGNQGGTNRYLCGDVWNHSSHHACLYLLKSIQCSHVYVHEYLAYLVVNHPAEAIQMC